MLKKKTLLLKPKRKRKPHMGDAMVKEFHEEHPEAKAVIAEIVRDSVGAPTDYKPEYCQQLIDHMSQGYSFESFSAKCGQGRATLYNWEKANPEFLEAKNKGKEQSLLFWETLGITGTAGKLRNFNAVAFIFNMKNKHQWRNESELTVRPGAPVPQIEATPDTAKLVKQIVSELDDEY